MSSLHSLLADCAELAAASPWIHLDPAAATTFATSADPALLRPPTWEDPGMLQGSAQEVTAWLLSYNAVNFCYWPDQGPRWFTVVDGRPVGQEDEALGIMVSFASAIRRGEPLGEGSWLQSLSAEALDRLLAPGPGAGRLPMMETRLVGLHELGRALSQAGGPLGLIEGATAPELVDRLVDRLPSWRDQRRWTDPQGQVRTLSFHKRAQLTVAMLSTRIPLEDTAALTAFADYRLPQILRGVGILQLHPDLAARIDAQELIEAGSEEEIALRAGIVHGAELVRQAIPGATALVVDHLLWRSAVARQSSLPPFHRTRTTDY